MKRLKTFETHGWRIDLHKNSYGKVWRFTSPYGLLFRASRSHDKQRYQYGLIINAEANCCRGRVVMDNTYTHWLLRQSAHSNETYEWSKLECSECQTKLPFNSLPLANTNLWQRGESLTENLQVYLEEILDPISAAFEQSTVQLLLEALDSVHQRRFNRYRRFTSLMARVIEDGSVA